jgi:ubiquitin carboxyl-terminal hydrolase 9/24
MQMDADEFFNNIMDKLDNQLKLTKQQHIITNVFQGEISNQLICEGCPHFSERYEDFLALGVTIKNKISLEQALKEFIKGEVLDGDNAYYCEKCEKKVRCLKRACIKELPNMLMIVLKRFEFDYDSMEKIKLNDYCEFPLNLDMKPYTKEFLKNDSQPGETVFRDDSYYQYSLKGTVVHHGTSEAGHYYSYIRIADDKWYEFNDEWIEKFDLADLKDETFGGAEESQYIEG